MNRLTDLDDKNIPSINDNNDNSMKMFFVQDYFSIQDKNIQQGMRHHRSSTELKEAKSISASAITDILSKQTYLIFFLEFNYFNLLKWAKDYLIGLHPELNFIVLIELDDDIRTQQKIVLIRSEEKNKFVPMNKLQDKKTGYRMIRFLNYSNKNYKNSHKLKIQMMTYSNDKLSELSEENIYFETNPYQEMNKFQFFNNIQSNTVMKKIGNIFFSYSYKTEVLSISSENIEEMHNKYLNELVVFYFQ